jgi:hypothetical protein
MLAKYQDDAEDIMLSKDVDEFWHTHILQTMKYADDCQKVFGTFLHHNPHIGERTPEALEERAKLAEKTRLLYQKEFGTPEAADVAWGGIVTKPNKAAYCDVALRMVNGAYCDATLQANAAYCDATVRRENAAYCDVTMTRVDKVAAYCDAALKATAAYCDAAVRPDKAAYCDASVKAAGTAYCDASVKNDKA